MVEPCRLAARPIPGPLLSRGPRARRPWAPARAPLQLRLRDLRGRTATPVDTHKTDE